MAYMKDKSYLIMADVIDPISNEEYFISPRNVLKKAIDQFKQNGYMINAASELEYYFYKGKYSENFNKGLHKLKEYGNHPEDYLIQQGDRYEHVYEKFRVKLNESGARVECNKGEAAIGQHEINILYEDVLTMSDTVLTLKNVFFLIFNCFSV